MEPNKYRKQIKWNQTGAKVSQGTFKKRYLRNLIEKVNKKGSQHFLEIDLDVVKIYKIPIQHHQTNITKQH